VSELTDRSHYSTGNPYERSVGFSRAVRVGNTVYTAGTIAVDGEGNIMGEDCYAQCCYIFDKLAGVLREAKAELRHVVKTTAYIVSPDAADGFSRAHFEYLGAVKPAATCVVVNALFHPAALVEIEFVAVIP
jgi:enamine deaminase RidA (YjgF/YER057c/UK114 family)